MGKANIMVSEMGLRLKSELVIVQNNGPDRCNGVTTDGYMDYVRRYVVPFSAHHRNYYTFSIMTTPMLILQDP